MHFFRNTHLAACEPARRRQILTRRGDFSRILSKHARLGSVRRMVWEAETYKLPPCSISWATSGFLRGCTKTHFSHNNRSLLCAYFNMHIIFFPVASMSVLTQFALVLWVKSKKKKQQQTKQVLESILIVRKSSRYTKFEDSWYERRRREHLFGHFACKQHMTPSF